MLRPYQVQALESLRNDIRAGNRHVLLVSPTGSGKTTIAAEIIRGAVAKGNPTLVVAHRRELVDQVVARLLQDHGISAGVVMAGRRRIDSLVMVASIQTLIRRERPPARLLIIDEAHHASAGSYSRIVGHYYPDASVIGLTATPWRLDGKGLSDLFDASVVAETPLGLTKLGFLCGATGRAYVSPDFTGVKTKGGDYDPAGLSQAYKSSQVLGDIVDRWREHCFGKRTIVFASSIENSEELVAGFCALGVAAEHIDYKTKRDERDAILARVRSGATRVISNVGILGEGVDVPELEVCVLARPTKSLAFYLQMVGRVLRPAVGKERAWINDHANCIVTHGFWDQERDYSLTVTRKKQPAAAPVRVCPECFATMPGGTAICPECGHVFDPQVSEVETGEYKELTIDELRALLSVRRDRDALIRSLEAEARAAGRRPGWVLFRLRDYLPPGFPFPRGWWRANVTGVKGDWRWRD